MGQINSKTWLAGFISFVAIAVMLVGCASQRTPAPALSPSPLPKTVTSLSNTVTLKPTQTVSPKNPLPDLPLSLGATWVYSKAVYSGKTSQDILTSTYIYTDVVIDTRSASPYFAAKIERTSTLIEGKPDYDLIGKGSWWYIISGTQVYQQSGNNLDFSKVSSSWLEYAFPLTKNRWYPDPDTRKNVSLDSMVSGIRYTFPETETIVPAGTFKDCFTIDTTYLNGPTLAWFCPKFGIVAEKFDHNGTPFGYHAVLMSYSIPPTP